MRPRVLLLSDVFPPKPGGSGRWLWELYRRLEDVDVTVLSRTTPGDAEFDRAAPLRIERLGPPLASWGIAAPRHALAYLRDVSRAKHAARGHRANVIHCAKALPEGLIGRIVQLRTGLPYWCFAHGEELTLARRTSRELRWLTRHVLRHAAGIIANSQHTRSLLLNDWGVTARKITVLTPGVDVQRFVPAERDDSVRAELGWSGRLVILTVGALQKRKGQDMLIRALPAIRARCPDVLYAIAGEGWEREYLEDLVRELDVTDAVQFLGVPDEVSVVRCYQQCDLFVLPNRRVDWDFEGFGIVLLEAQACGKPVIAGASGGTGETLLPGVTGEIVNCDEPGPLVAACSSLCADADRRQRLGAGGRAWVLEKFDWTVLKRQAAAVVAASAAPPV